MVIIEDDIQHHFNWLDEQLTDIVDKDYIEARNLRNVAGFKYTGDHYEKDVLSTADLLTKAYEGYLGHCGLAPLEKRLSSTHKPIDIDYFFIRMHILFHVLVERESPHDEDIEEGEFLFIECTGLMFAAIACYRYFAMPNMTRFMLKELIAVLLREASLKEEGELVHSHNDKVKLLTKTLTVLFSNDLKFRQ